jgi:hypothetical protein
MKSIFCNCLAWLVVCLMAASAFHGPAAAESIESQCRSAVRAEMQGPNCRMPEPKFKYYQPGDPCYILGDTKLALYTDKVIECIRRGGRGKR